MWDLEAATEAGIKRTDLSGLQIRGFTYLYIVCFCMFTLSPVR